MRDEGGHDLRRVYEIRVDIRDERYRVFFRFDHEGDEELIVLLCCADKAPRSAMPGRVYAQVADLRDAYEGTKRRAIATVTP